MQDVNIEFNRGVLFVRISGILDEINEEPIRKKVLEIIQEGGIKNLVFNVQNLQINGSVSIFKQCKNIINANKGKMILCTNNNISLKYVDNAKDELEALRMINA